MEFLSQLLGWLAVLTTSSGIRFGEPPAPENPAQFNTVALVAGKSSFFCSGSLIAEDIVLTAVHCLARVEEIQKRGGQVNIFFGPSATAWSISRKSHLLRPVVEWRAYYHPLAHSTSAYVAVRDLGWLRFSGGLPEAEKGETPFAPLPILSSREEFESLSLQTHKFLIAGYGKNENAFPTPVRRVAELSADDHRFFPKGDLFRSLNTLALSTNNLKATVGCSGDSGGPLYVLIPQGRNQPARWHILGVLSLGNKTCRQGNGNMFELVLEDASWFLEDPYHDLAHREVPPLIRNQEQIPRPTKGSLEDWCKYSNSMDPAWMTVSHLFLNAPKKYYLDRSETSKNLRCDKLESLALEQIQRDRGQLRLEYPPKKYSSAITFPFLKYLMNPAGPGDYIEMDLTPLLSSPEILDAVQSISLKNVRLTSAPDYLWWFPRLKEIRHTGSEISPDLEEEIESFDIEVISKS